MTVKAQTNLAVFLAESGQIDEARAMMAEALAHSTRAYGPDRVSLAKRTRRTLEQARARLADP